MNLRPLLLILVLLGVGVGVFFALPRWEANPPEISLQMETTVLGPAPGEVGFLVEDPGSGLRTVELRLTSAAGTKTLASKHFTGALTTGGEVFREQMTVSLDPSELGLPDGDATLTATATDWSLRNGFSGNSTEEVMTLVIDTVPPKVAAISGLTYIHRGGAAAVIYRVSQDAARHGVRVADTFFQGHTFKTGESDLRIAIFAVPVDAPPDPAIRVVATDAAGNERTASFDVRLIEREMVKRRLSLSKSFLEHRASPLALANGFSSDDPVRAFRDVNEVLRERNESRIRELLGDDPVAKRFAGAFEQMRGSQVTSRFAEQRQYLIDDKEVSRAVHYGFDLASTAGAKVTAANAGVVALAEDLGIYGNCVVIDHGLGVRSLYGHLREIAVEKGAVVSKGELLGRSGATGLAGGDHLHFAILVGGAYVDPLEWWDGKWVRTHIEERITASSE